MSTPQSYAWPDYIVLVRIETNGGHVFPFLVCYKAQEEFMEHAVQYVQDRGRRIVGMQVETLTEDSYDILKVMFAADQILE